MGLEWAKRRQDDPNEDIKSLKVPKSSIYKECNSIVGKQYFSRLGGSQDEHKRLRKAPKKHLKSFKTSKKCSKNEPKQFNFLAHVSAVVGPDIDPKTC